MFRPTILSGCPTRNAPRMFSARCGRVNPICETVARVRTRHAVSNFAPSTTECLSRSPRDEFRLIEPALTTLRRVQRDGNHQYRFRDIQLADRLGQHPAEYIRSGLDLPIFQQMNQLAQFAIIRTVGASLVKQRSRLPAIAAAMRFIRDAQVPIMPSPQIAQVSIEIGEIAERQSRHTGSREIFSSGAPHRRQSEGKSAANRPWATIAAPEAAATQRASPMGSRGASYVSGTAEDQPPSPGAWFGSSRTNCSQYSGEAKGAQLLRRRRGL